MLLLTLAIPFQRLPPRQPWRLRDLPVRWPALPRQVPTHQRQPQDGVLHLRGAEGEGAGHEEEEPGGGGGLLKAPHGAQAVGEEVI